jgi:hypothetical protein
MQRVNIKRDLITVVVITAISYLIFTQIDVLEKIVLFAAEHEDLELDELISSSIVFSICMAFYAYRWWRASIKYNAQLAKKNEELQAALDEIKVLRGVIPICSYCKKIRDDNDAWEQLEAYLDAHSEAEFSHGICPDCYKHTLEEEETL